MGVSVDKRCFFYKCRATGQYEFKLLRVKDGAEMKEGRVCGDHRDYLELVLQGLTKSDQHYGIVGPAAPKPRQRRDRGGPSVVPTGLSSATAAQPALVAGG